MRKLPVKLSASGSYCQIEHHSIKLARWRQVRPFHRVSNGLGSQLLHYRRQFYGGWERVVVHPETELVYSNTLYSPTKGAP